MTHIDVSPVALAALQARRQPGESLDDALCRLLGVQSMSRRTSVGELVDRGHLASGTRLYLARRSGLVEASVHADGSIEILTPGSAQGTYNTPSAAAMAVTGSQVNGWASWRVVDTGKTLAELRDRLAAAGKRLADQNDRLAAAGKRLADLQDPVTARGAHNPSAPE